jgi:hypothetical protein
MQGGRGIIQHIFHTFAGNYQIALDIKGLRNLKRNINVTK